MSSPNPTQPEEEYGGYSPIDEDEQEKLEEMEFDTI